MRRTKAEVDRYISSVENSSPSLKEKSVKGFLFAKLYFEAKEYELAKRHVSAYLAVRERDPKAHKFLGQLYEKEGDINKAVGCYKRSVDLNPVQRDVVLKVAELLCSKPEPDSRAEVWVEKAAKLLPGSPAIYNLKEKLLGSQGQRGQNQLFDLLHSELQLRPGDVHVNVRLVQLYCSDGRLEEAVKHCLASEKKRVLLHSLDWYSTVVHTLQDYLTQPSVLSNDKMCGKLHKELLLAHCNLLRLTLSERGVQQGVEALQSFDHAMQSLKRLNLGCADRFAEVFSELRGHLYLHAGTLLLKMAHDKQQQWRAVVDLAALCYLLAYQVPRPKSKPPKGDQTPHRLVDLLAFDRQSQSGHMLLNLNQDCEVFVKEVVEAFGNRSGQGSLFEMLFGSQAPVGPSFIGNDDIRSIAPDAPERADLMKWDDGAIMLHAGDLQHLTWLGLQWAMKTPRPALRDWLRQLFPRLTLETSKLDTNSPESICLLDLEVFLCGVVFTSHTQLQETSKITSSTPLHEPRCLPLPLLKLLSTERQRIWWDAVYSLIHQQAQPGTSAKLRMVVQHGLGTLRAAEKHGLQPALLIHWAQHLSEMGAGVNSYYDQKEYIGRSVHYWKVVLPFLECVKRRRSVPVTLDPMFVHFHSKDIQISAVKGFEDEAMVAFATLLDIEGRTDEAITTLESIDSLSSNWHLAQIYRRLSEEAGNGVEETQDRCVAFLLKYRTHLKKIHDANAAEMEQLPVSLVEVTDFLNDVNQQLGESEEPPRDVVDGSQPFHSSPRQFSPLIEPDGGSSASRMKFSTPSPAKRHTFSPKTPPHWVEDQKSILQTLCQQIEALKKEVHDLKLNSSGHTASPHHRLYGEGYSTDALQDTFPAGQSFQGVPLTVATTGPTVYYNNQSSAYNSQYLLRTAANVTPTKAPVYGINRLPPQQHMYAFQQPTHTPPLQTTPACMYPQDQVYGPPMRFESPATNLLSPYSEEYYSHAVPQPTTNPPLPEPGYFTKPSVVPVQPPKSGEAKPVDFGKISFDQQIPVEPPKVPSFGAGVIAQSTPTSAAFKFNSNFKSNDGDFTFSSTQVKNNSESLLGLLTSDMPPRTEGNVGLKTSAQDQSASQGGIFNFGGKSTGFSFSNVAQNQGKPNPFGKADQPFSFADVSKPVFGNGGIAEQDERNAESDNESTRVEEDEDGPHFEPIVPLPDKVDVKTGEEEEEEMFCNRAKLFRFDTETKEWKERGIGGVKILRHRTTGKVRLLMRREQVLKICANHYITAEMVLKANAGSDKSWVWYAIDYADEMPKPEQLAIRFKTADEAALFKAKFEEAQKVVCKNQDQKELKDVSAKAPVLKPAGKDSGFGALFAKKEGEWDCPTCCIRNTSAAMKCVACQSDNPKAKSLTGSLTSGFGKEAPNSSSPSGPFAKMPTSFKFGTGSATSTPAGFGDQFAKKDGDRDQSEKIQMPSQGGLAAMFGKKDGEWDCDTCLVRNVGSSSVCASCQTPKLQSEKIQMPSQGGLAAMFGKKDGEWDCDTCLVRNVGSSSVCASCQTPKLQSEKIQMPSQGGLAAMFGKKDGEWDCDTCLVRNVGSSSVCASCQTPKLQSEKIQMPSQGGLAAMFGKKDGEWDCDTCLVRNVGSSSVCASCQTPKLQSEKIQMPSQGGLAAMFGKKDGEWDCDTCLVRNVGSSSVCASCQTPKLQSEKIQMPSQGGLAAMFGKKDGEWDCDTCLVRNVGSSSVCASCQTPNPAAAPSASDFSFSFGSKTASNQPVATGFKANFASSGAFKFGQVETKSSPGTFKFEPPTTTSSSGFSFSMPVPVGGFKFGTQEPVKPTPPAEGQTPDVGSASMFLKSIAEQHREKENESGVSKSSVVVPSGQTEHDENPIFTGKPNTFSFADLAKASPGEFQFGQKDPNFKGFSRAGEQLFSSIQPNQKGDTSADLDEEGMYKTEENDDIQFEPVVQMPEKVDLVTGEEDEEVLYSQRVKLFRFDADTSQWKERGVGNLKFLKNSENGRLRVLMRREQVFKVCANHWITTTMNLKPLSGSDKAWMWLANDFSDGGARLEQLAAKFKTPELAEEFKLKFEECQRLLLDIPLQTPHKLVDTGRTAHLIQKAEEMKSGLKDLKSFLTDDKTVITEDESQVKNTTAASTSGHVIKPHCERTGPSLEWDNYDLREEALDDSVDTSVYASPIASSPIPRNLFRFGESTSGFSFSFQPILSPSKSPAKLNQSRVSVGTDEESETTQEEERDCQYFEPVVPLPDLVDTSTGEENEQTVFSHRAKLYRYDKSLSQWKERGIGDLKILQDYNTKRVRVIMRRDQVLKLCANHWVTPDTKLEPMSGTERAWIWSALDYAEGEGRVEQLAVRFKLQEVANSFKELFDEAKNAQETNTLVDPHSSREATPQGTPCGKAAIAVLEETTKERTDLLSQSFHTPDGTSSPTREHKLQGSAKAVVSPPKFVFGTDSVLKIFGSPSSSKETASSPKFEPKDEGNSAFRTTSAVVGESSTVTSPMSTWEVPERADRPVVTESPEGRVIAEEVPDQPDSEEVQVVFAREPTPEQAELARRLMLPLTFFCYQNDPGYNSDDPEDDEDFVTAVRRLNGQLYPDPCLRATSRQSESLVEERDSECVVIWEKRPTFQEEEKAKSLQLPPTFFCGVGSDTEAEKDKAEDFETEVRKVQEALTQKMQEGGGSSETAVSSSSDPSAARDAVAPAAAPEPQPDSSSDAPHTLAVRPSSPIDLSTKKTCEPDSTSHETTSFGFHGMGEFSFADLAKNTDEFAFGRTDSNFTWANAGATVFGQAVMPQPREEEEGSDEEASNNVDIHFEPIVSLPEVVTKSGEEDEEILFKERTKLYRWDRDMSQWKERGVGDMKILYNPLKRYYRVLMRREQVLKVCANHTITQAMELKPMNTSANALVWIATDYAEGDGKVEQLAAKFKTADLAESFKKKFKECQSRLSQTSSCQLSRIQELSMKGNPLVYMDISVDDEPLGRVTMELFSHITPKTAENFRALCTGERGFGFRASVFHRVIPDFMCQGGDITKQDGTGGRSVYGGDFEDENFDVRHTGPGVLSMANHGRDTNNSQFFITLKKAEHLDFKHVAFGFVKGGMDVVLRMGLLGTKTGKPSKEIVVSECGQL